MLKKAIFLFFIALAAVACQKEKFQLKWKVPAGEVLIYSIKMETIDSLSSVAEENLEELVEMVAKMYGDSVEVAVDANDLYNGLIRQLNLLSYFSIIRQGSGNDLKVDFITRQTKQYGEIKYRDIFNKFIKKAFFKGSMLPNGNLVSSAGEPAWDPKINILFELPEKPVAIGESWALNVVPKWQKTEYEQADSMINQVTLTDIVVEAGDSLAILKYQLQSPDKSGRTISFTGNAGFNMNSGRWISYTGVLSQKTAGMLPMTQVQQIKLTEISVEKYKSILKQAQKVDIFDQGRDFEEHNNENDQVENNQEEDHNEAVNQIINPDCPEVFRVQILASQNPVKDKAVQFKGLKYPVDEIILSGQFKYKYTVGKECDKAKANALLAEIKTMGYPQAYIIKTPNK